MLTAAETRTVPGTTDDDADIWSPRHEDKLGFAGQHLLRNGSALVEVLVALPHVSCMTLHRDLDGPTQRGRLHRTRGGARVQRTLLLEKPRRQCRRRLRGGR